MPKLSLGAVAEGVKCEQQEKKIVIGNDEVKFFGVQLPPREKEELIDFLRNNIDVFAWSTYEALGVDPDFICHNLNVNPFVLFKKQPLRRLSREHFDAVQEEVLKLKRVGAIKEVFYPECWPTR